MKKTEYKGKPAVRTARKNGISDAAFYQRIHRGWTVAAAVKTPLYPSKNQWVITNKNMTFKSASALAKYLGTTKNAIIGREYRHGSPFKIGRYKIEKR